MTKKASKKEVSPFRKYFWEIFLVVLSVALSLFAPKLWKKIFPEKKPQSDTPIINYNIESGSTPKLIQKTPPNKKTIFVKDTVFVNVEISANSTDQILIDGKEQTVFSDQLTTSKFVRLIKGKTYTIKIGSCPEIKITPTTDTLIDRCPNP